MDEVTEKEAKALSTALAVALFVSLKKYTLWLVGTSLVLFMLIKVVMLLPLFYDSTDSWPFKSGMSLMVDAQTGCEYLGDGGALTPRLSSEGKHICKKAEDGR